MGPGIVHMTRDGVDLDTESRHGEGVQHVISGNLEAHHGVDGITT